MKNSLKKLSIIAIVAVFFSCEKEEIENPSDESSLNFELTKDVTDENEALESIEDFQ